MDAGSSIEKHIVWDCHYLHFWLGRYPVGPIWHRHLALRPPHGGISLRTRDEEEEVADFPRTPLDHGKMCFSSLFQADLVPKTPGLGEYPPKRTHSGAGEGMLPKRLGWSLWGCRVSGHWHCEVSVGRRSPWMLGVDAKLKLGWWWGINDNLIFER